jgi:hypothetical protein
MARLQLNCNYCAHSRYIDVDTLPYRFILENIDTRKIPDTTYDCYCPPIKIECEQCHREMDITKQFAQMHPDAINEYFSNWKQVRFTVPCCGIDKGLFEDPVTIRTTENKGWFFTTYKDLVVVQCISCYKKYNVNINDFPRILIKTIKK